MVGMLFINRLLSLYLGVLLVTAHVFMSPAVFADTFSVNTGGEIPSNNPFISGAPEGGSYEELKAWRDGQRERINQMWNSGSQTAERQRAATKDPATKRRIARWVDQLRRATQKMLHELEDEFQRRVQQQSNNNSGRQPPSNNPPYGTIRPRPWEQAGGTTPPGGFYPPISGTGGQPQPRPGRGGSSQPPYTPPSTGYQPPYTPSTNTSPPSSTIPSTSTPTSTVPEDQLPTADLRPNHPNLTKKLADMGNAMAKRAGVEIFDPAKRAATIHNITEKMDGIGDGVNEAKDEIFKTGETAFNELVKETESFKEDPAGTLQEAAEAARAFGTGLANAAEQTLDTAVNDPGKFNILLKGAIEATEKYVDDYSKMTPRKQGKELGKMMTWNAIFGGASKVGGQALGKAKDVLKPHAQQLGAELKAALAAGKDKLGAGARKLAAAASRWGSGPALAHAGVGSNWPPRGPPGATSPWEDLYNMAKSGAEKAAGKFKPAFGDMSKIKEGWKLDGATVEELPWPDGWIKSGKGDFGVIKGKLNFKPSAQAMKDLKKFLKPGDLIPYKHGVPDFKKWAWKQKNFVIDGLDGSDADFPKIYKYLAEQGWEGATSANQVKIKLAAQRLTPHHFHTPPGGNGSQVQLVPMQLHDYFKHTGDAFKLRNPAY